MPRQTRETIPVYSSSGHNNIIRRVSFWQAMRMIEIGDARPLRRFGHRDDLFGIRLMELERLQHDDPTTITARESELNALAAAGLSGDRALLRRVQQKIAAWPEITDDKTMPIASSTEAGTGRCTR